MTIASGYAEQAYHRRVGLLATGPREPKVTKLTTRQTGVVKLSPLDFIEPFLWTPLLIPFENVNDEADFMPDDRMIDSLQQAIERVPIVTGRLERIDGTPVDMDGPNSPMQVRIGKGGVWYTSARIEGSFKDFRASGFSYEQLDPRFLFRTANDALLDEVDYPLFAVKVNRFECGSVVLLVMGCHLVVDARSTYELLRTWSMLYCAVPDAPLVKEARHLIGYDDELNKASRAIHGRFETMPASTPSPFKPTKLVLASIDAQRFRAYKEQINSELAPEYASSDDVMLSLGWRAFSRARRLEAGDPTRLIRMVDVRRLNYPPLPPAAFGNCVLAAITGPQTASFLLGSRISEVCRIVRASLTALDPSTVRDTTTALSQCTKLGNPGGSSVPFSSNVLSTSYANFHPDKIDFQRSPALTVTRACYTEGMVSPQPIVNGTYSCKVAIDATQVDAFINDPDLLDAGFTFKL